MPPKGMKVFIDRKNKSSDSPAPSKTPKKTLTREQAREQGFYLDPHQLSEHAGPTSKRPAANDTHRPFSPSPLSRGSSRDVSPEFDHGVFDTDASLRDDISSANGLDDNESFGDLKLVGYRSRQSTALSDDERLPLDPPRHHHDDVLPAVMKDPIPARQATPSSYPATTADGSRDSREKPASVHERDSDDARALKSIYAAPPPSPNIYMAQSARATGGSSAPADSIPPAVRGLYGSRFTIVRDLIPPQPAAPRTRIDDLTQARPTTSRGLELPAPPARMTNAPMAELPPALHTAAKSSTLGDASDPESSPPPAEVDELDYPPDQLRAMHFGDLRGEAVDKFPDVPAVMVETTADLEGLLAEALGSGDRNRQSALLESLSLDRWEEAGDWFVARQADISKRWIALRKEKRRLALELEKEMEERHNLINEKKQVLQENLKGLREAGVRVLEVGTPKKRKA